MDAQYHSYIDVTSTLGSYGIKTLVFVPERICLGSIVKFHFFNNNSYSINPNAITLHKTIPNDPTKYNTFFEWQ